MVIKLLYKDKIKTLRENNNITQEELANILGIKRGLYSLYENEYNIMPLKHIITIANYFNVSIDYIFSFTDIKQYKNYNNQELDYIKIGNRLKEFRKNNHLTQVKLASILNTVHPVITNYEKGKHLIATPFLYTICKTYHLSADYILGKID